MDKIYYMFSTDSDEYVLFIFFFMFSILYNGYRCIRTLIEIFTYKYDEYNHPRRFDLSPRNIQLRCRKTNISNQKELIKEITAQMKLVDNVSVKQTSKTKQ